VRGSYQGHQVAEMAGAGAQGQPAAAVLAGYVVGARLPPGIGKVAAGQEPAVGQRQHNGGLLIEARRVDSRPSALSKGTW
jgi:hypothetical protein